MRAGDNPVEAAVVLLASSCVVVQCFLGSVSVNESRSLTHMREGREGTKTMTLPPPEGRGEQLTDRG